MVKVSVIIPVYNVSQYLPQCLDSILNQDFGNLEIICINDGSTDDSMIVLNEYASKDNRIIIIDKINEGSGVARNEGIKAARGEYIYFVDGDDWLEDYAIEKMVTKADSETTDILVFGGYSGYVKNEDVKKSLGGYSVSKIPKKYFNRIFSAKDIKNDIFKFPSTAWTKLYRKEFLDKNGIKFQEIKVGQDQLFFFHSMITAKKICVLNENLYCYRKNRVGSAMTVKKKKNFSPVYVFYAVEELLYKNNLMKEYQYLFTNKYFSKATSWLGHFDENLKPEYYKIYMELLNHIKKSNPCGWWKYFEPNECDGYWKLKFKKNIAQKKYSIFK